MLAEIHRRPGVNIQGKTIYRTAVRAVIQRGKDLLMVYSSNVGDYKFPGGGMDDIESLIESYRHAILEKLKLICHSN
jgi:hypothetical protein